MRFHFLVAACLLSACAARIDTPTIVDKPFPAPAPAIATVDIAPLDIGLSVEGAASETEAVRSQAAATLVNTAIDALDKRSYAVTMVLKKHQKSTADATLYIRGSSFVPHVQPGPDTRLQGGGGSLAYNAWSFERTRCDTACSPGDSPQTCSPPPECASLSPFPPAEEEPSPPVEPLNDNAEVGDAQDPSLFVTMSLWDNRTGEMLWRAHVDAAANAAHPDEVAQVARALIKSLPARR